MILSWVDCSLALKEIWKNVSIEILRGNSKVPIKEENKLHFHQVDFEKGE